MEEVHARIKEEKSYVPTVTDEQVSYLQKKVKNFYKYVQIDLSLFKEGRYFVFDTRGQNLINLILTLVYDGEPNPEDIVSSMSMKEFFHLEDTYKKALESKGLPSEIPVKKLVEKIKGLSIEKYPDFQKILENMTEFLSYFYPEDEERPFDEFMRIFKDYLVANCNNKLNTHQNKVIPYLR